MHGSELTCTDRMGQYDRFTLTAAHRKKVIRLLHVVQPVIDLPHTEYYLNLVLSSIGNKFLLACLGFFLPVHWFVRIVFLLEA